ncbi:MAG: hypothetical protein ACT4TC_18170 [Myxococcaceae bacterium]
MHSRVKARFHPLKDLELERYLCGDLSDEERERVERLLFEQPEARQYVAERRAEQAAFKLRQPPLRLAEQAPARSPWLWGGSLVAASMALVLALVFFASHRVGSELPPRIATRGAAKIAIAVLRGTKTFEYQEGVLLAAGDRIRLTIESASSEFATVLARDPQNRLTVQYDNEPLTPGSTTLPGSLKLDTTAGPETLIVFLSPRAVPLAERLERYQREGLGNEGRLIRLEKEPLP